MSEQLTGDDATAIDARLAEQLNEVEGAYLATAKTAQKKIIGKKKP
ncbi:hypothetical protein G7009_13750 [Pseudomonas capeferrum]|nr:hypothetical protein [Pseudomonas capeferrum]MBA1202804.1 hypothetical protein [Pseudomonas capeferrum]